MSVLNWLKLLVDLRKGWKSKSINFGRLLSFLPVIDVSFFGSGIGETILQGFMKLLNLVPFFGDVTPVQATSFLIVVIGNVVVWLRTRTTESVEGK